MAETRDIIIIGGGPGGYVAALRGAQLKRKVTLIERDLVGGTCINYGCIPTKYLLHVTKVYKEIRSAGVFRGPKEAISVDWPAIHEGRRSVVDRLVKGIVFLLEKARVEIVKGTAGIGPDKTVTALTAEGERHFVAEHVVIATGSRAAGLPFLEADGRTVLTSTEALELADVPRSLLVVGAGAIGLEIGSLKNPQGTDVTVLEIMPGVLPGSDRESALRLERILKKQGLKVFTHMKIEEARAGEGGVVCKGTCLRTRTPFEYGAEKALLAAGRKPNVAGLFDGPPAVELGSGGFIKVDHRMETSVRGIYAIGDVVGGKLLAHKAYHDAVVAVENASGLDRSVDYDALPSAVFTDPEFATVGLTQEEAAERGVKVRTGVFPLQASGRALTMDSTDGMIKIVADESGRVIGAHLLAPGASDMIPVLTVAIAKRMTVEEIGSTIYVHPSLSEAIGEAALKVNNEALHLLNI